MVHSTDQDRMDGPLFFFFFFYMSQNWEQSFTVGFGWSNENGLAKHWRYILKAVEVLSFSLVLERTRWTHTQTAGGIVERLYRRVCLTLPRERSRLLLVCSIHLIHKLKHFTVGLTLYPSITHGPASILKSSRDKQMFTQLQQHSAPNLLL